jgi:L-ribulokinase
MAKYVIGIDFGTLSARAILVNVETGEESPRLSEQKYPHAVMETELPNGVKLPVDYALQDPRDYTMAISAVCRDLLEGNKITADDVVGLGIDFTACTVLPIDKDGVPLCTTEKYEKDPLAWVQLWKHHGAQDYANRITEIAESRGEDFLPKIGGKEGSEAMFPRLWKICEEDPELYDDMDEYIEAGDWIVGQITGRYGHNSCATAGIRGLWYPDAGFPSPDFFKALNPKMENVIGDKIKYPITTVGTRAGVIDEKGAEMTGLNVGTPVAVPLIDCYSGVPGSLNAPKAGQLCLVMGTSGCHMMLGDEYHIVPGTYGGSKDNMIPGLYGYEAGQSGFGDHLAWYVANGVPEEYEKAAHKAGRNIHQYLTDKAEKLAPGESGLLALDWWNGNRSILVDNDLTGTMLGLRLTTKPEEIYRALIEAIAYGTRIIVENFEQNGVPVKEIYASGGMSRKNDMLMQIFADVTGRPIKIASSENCGALGAAVLASLAAGSDNGGYDDTITACSKLVSAPIKEFEPDAKAHATYDKLFDEYVKLHDYFGRGENDVMKRLKAIQAEAISSKED